MGIASEIDTLLKKSKEVGLTEGEIIELKCLWEAYITLNMLYGHKIRPFSEVLKEVKLLSPRR